MSRHLKAAAAIVTALAIGIGRLAAAELSPQGANLGRLFSTDFGDGLQIAVTGAAIERDIDFLIARAQDNRPVMRAADGTWHPWTGEPSQLIDCGCRFGGPSATFALGNRPPTELSLPVTLTFGSRSFEGLSFGYIVVDAP